MVTAPRAAAAGVCRYLRCRKALSTSAYRVSAASRAFVQIPQMPKGVEHSAGTGGYGPGQNVQIPQMPKGVEHKFDLEVEVGAGGGADTSDAERR